MFMSGVNVHRFGCACMCWKVIRVGMEARRGQEQGLNVPPVVCDCSSQFISASLDIPFLCRPQLHVEMVLLDHSSSPHILPKSQRDVHNCNEISELKFGVTK
jgi:hypothetical protein